MLFVYKTCVSGSRYRQSAFSPLTSTPIPPQLRNANLLILELPTCIWDMEGINCMIRTTAPRKIHHHPYTRPKIRRWRLLETLQGTKNLYFDDVRVIFILLS